MFANWQGVMSSVEGITTEMSECQLCNRCSKLATRRYFLEYACSSLADSLENISLEDASKRAESAGERAHSLTRHARVEQDLSAPRVARYASTVMRLAVAVLALTASAVVVSAGTFNLMSGQEEPDSSRKFSITSALRYLSKAIFVGALASAGAYASPVERENLCTFRRHRT